MTAPRHPPPGDGPEPLVPPQHSRTIWRVMGGTLVFHAVAAVVLWQVAQSTQTGAMGTDDVVAAVRPADRAGPSDASTRHGAENAVRSAPLAAGQPPAANRTDWFAQAQRKDRSTPWSVDVSGNVMWPRK